MGFTLLHGLAACAKYEDALQILDISPDAVFEKDEWGCTPLHYSCEKGHQVITNALLDSGAEINDVDRFSHAPIYLACREGQVETVRDLLSRSADPRRQNATGSTPLHAAAGSTHASAVIQLLLQAHADAAAVDGFSNTALHIAARQGDADAAQLLAAEGVDPRTPNLFGSSALDLAATPAARAAMSEGRRLFRRSNSGLAGPAPAEPRA
jgi:ankyrin repeat protein